MRIASIAALMLVLSSAVASAHPTPRLPIITQGCQGEGCFVEGVWPAKLSVPLYARAGDAKPIGTVSKGKRLTALRRVILTTRVGSAVLTKDVPDYAGGKLTPLLKKGTRVGILLHKGEGVYVALVPSGAKAQVHDDEFRAITKFHATDWVDVLVEDGRRGWIQYDYSALACSSHYDDDIVCRRLNKRYWVPLR